MYRIAITGIGIVSCLGCSAENVARALSSGQSGVVIDEERERHHFRSALTGMIHDFNVPDDLSRKQKKTMTEFGVWAYSAAEQAITLSGLEREDLRNDRTGLIFSCDSSNLAPVNALALLEERGATSLVGSGQVFQSMTSNVTLNLSVIFGIQGACWTIASACAGGGHAIGQAADLIALGRQDRVLCGGAQEINWQSMVGFDGISAFSCRADSPQSASRPFDIDRDGLVPSGGAAVLLLERYDLAQKRGATILGEVAGYGFSTDGTHLSIPSGLGLERASRNALKSAQLSPADIDYVCAHATSTRVGDAVEAETISRLFEDCHPYVSSIKSMTGHELWMAGSSQAVYTTIMAQYGFIAPNINLEHPDPKAQSLRLVSQTVSQPPKRALLNAMGFGGVNSSLVLRFDHDS
ncbi:beta-ketoacyl-[acyl-carrier-protein] synthase family protein [Desulfovibrio inopinatus]|uniref:beta-ketoacyl-[acyl-carrier-protein] synthase family protein n=1 Tax=Desulfovibrio inopinatus TaxID=102109 RepID=UPI00040A64FD|nr:beta-ketoacyl-[acyl-carrier-protein] synthase family protein [Desulfovibrio inopinatus]